ncbi:MAG: hypothetical protein R3E86_00635 [Pseudomonadales bacterium]
MEADHRFTSTDHTSGIWTTRHPRVLVFCTWWWEADAHMLYVKHAGLIREVPLQARSGESDAPPELHQTALEVAQRMAQTRR